MFLHVSRRSLDDATVFIRSSTEGRSSASSRFFLLSAAAALFSSSAALFFSSAAMVAALFRSAAALVAAASFLFFADSSRAAFSAAATLAAASSRSRNLFDCSFPQPACPRQMQFSLNQRRSFGGTEMFGASPMTAHRACRRLQRRPAQV